MYQYTQELEAFASYSGPEEKSHQKTCFLNVEAGDHVIIEENSNFTTKSLKDWWIGLVLFCYGGSREPNANSLFQVVDIDTGKIKTINGDKVKEILKKHYQEED